MRDYKKQLLKKLRTIVTRYIKVAYTQIEQQYSIEDTTDGEAHLLIADMTVAQDTVARSLIAYGQKAWILEYGKGSLMETNPDKNPFLADYIKSDNFNEARISNAYAVTGRKCGDYYDLDGNKHTSHGQLYGKNLEEWVDKKTGKQAVYASSPKHIIQHVLFGSGDNGLFRMMGDEIQQAMIELLSDMLKKNWRKEIKLL